MPGVDALIQAISSATQSAKQTKTAGLQALPAHDSVSSSISSSGTTGLLLNESNILQGLPGDRVTQYTDNSQLAPAISARAESLNAELGEGSQLSGSQHDPALLANAQTAAVQHAFVKTVSSPLDAMARTDDEQTTSATFAEPAPGTADNLHDQNTTFDLMLASSQSGGVRELDALSGNQNEAQKLFKVTADTHQVAINEPVSAVFSGPADSSSIVASIAAPLRTKGPSTAEVSQPGIDSLKIQYSLPSDAASSRQESTTEKQLSAAAQQGATDHADSHAHDSITSLAEAQQSVVQQPDTAEDTTMQQALASGDSQAQHFVCLASLSDAPQQESPLQPSSDPARLPHVASSASFGFEEQQEELPAGSATHEVMVQPNVTAMAQAEEAERRLLTGDCPALDCCTLTHKCSAG